MSNGIQATMSPRVGNVGDTYEIGFSSPAEADPVTITLTEVDAWGSGSGRVSEGGRNIPIGQFTGTISGGNFTPSASPSPPTPGTGPAVRVTFAGDASATVHTLPIPASAQSNENGVFEVQLSVRGRVGGRNRTYTMPHPVFLRDFQAGRPEVAFVTGTSGGFFTGAWAFFGRHADGRFRLTNVLEIREFLRTQADARGYGPWGDVNIVSHGNAVEWFIRLQRSDSTPRHLRWWDVQAAAADPAMSTDVTAQLDSTSRVIIRGCAIGNDQQLLDQIRALFGGQCTVLAPKFLQFYHTGGTATAPREGFYEFFFIYAKQQTAPDDATCATRLNTKYSSAGISNADWLRMLGNRTEDPNGFRASDGGGQDRHETIPWRVSVTVNGPRDQARQTMATYDWSGEAESGFDNADPDENLETSYSDWHWVEGPVVETPRGAQVTVFTREYTGHRIRIEVRRELRTTGGTPVDPDLSNADHYGTAP